MCVWVTTSLEKKMFLCHFSYIIIVKFPPTTEKLHQSWIFNWIIVSIVIMLCGIPSKTNYRILGSPYKTCIPTTPVGTSCQSCQCFSMQGLVLDVTTDTVSPPAAQESHHFQIVIITAYQACCHTYNLTVLMILVAPR